jgi:uncharacterized protein (DUF58 family)
MNELLTAETIGRFRTLDLIARHLVEGFITGLHRSPYHGFSVEFSQHRPYMPGDELRHVDWRLYARSDRFHIKQYEEETNLRCHLLLDGSASMGFGSGPVSKFRWSVMFAAALSWLMIRQQDAVGLLLFDEEARLSIPPRSVRSHLGVLLTALDRWRPAGGTRSAAVLHRLAESLKRRGLVVLISDLFDDEDALLDGIKHFRHLGHEVLVFHPLDPAERDFGRLSGGRFRDMETGEELSADPRLVAEEVNARLAAFTRRFKQRCRAEGVDFVEADISRPFDTVLLEYLIKRKRVAG